LVESARRRLGSGADVRTVLLEILADGAAPYDATIAVCVAAGSTPEQAQDRYKPFEGLWDFLEPGEEADGADTLVALRYFEPDAVLNGQERESAALLGAALATLPGYPAGFGLTFHHDLRTGQLAKAFLLAEMVGAGRWKDNGPFWAAMSRAGETLAGTHDEVMAAYRRCRESAARL
jgi:hypothetical protein